MTVPSELIRVFKSKASFLAHIHLSPDPDTIGSALALKLAFEAEGKLINLYCEDPLIDIARFLPEIDSVEQTSMKDALTYPHEVYLCLDTAKWELATRNTKQTFTQPVVVIDHHPDNNIKSKLKWVDPDASSTAQLVFALLEALGWTVTPDIATCLLFGLLGDTGLLQNLNTKSSDLALAQKLMELGASYHQSLLNMARSYTHVDIEAMAKALANVKYAPDGSYAWVALDYKDCRSLKADPKIGVLANLFANRFGGTEFGAIIVEKERGITKGSLRSRVPEFDVSAVAHRLGGGGHKNSASFKLELNLEAAEKEFLAAVAAEKNK